MLPKAKEGVKATSTKYIEIDGLMDPFTLWGENPHCNTQGAIFQQHLWNIQPFSAFVAVAHTWWKVLLAGISL